MFYDKTIRRGKAARQPGSRVRSLRFEPLEHRVLLAITTVDPADGLRLMNPRVLGEWNTAGNLDGWTVANAASSSVASGVLTVTSQTGANPVQVSLSSIASGPYLDYGYFSYLQTRVQLPANFNRDVTFSFGTSTHTGFASDRQFVIPAAQVAKDGAWHTYRLDLGLQVWWKDTLSDLRIQPVGGAGTAETASLDYVEVGDLPGDVLTAYATNLNMASGVTAATRQSVESKHFVFWWDPAVNPGGRTNFTTDTYGNGQIMARNALRMMEECYQVYVKIQGYLEPFNYVGDGLRHKINMTTWYGGYWMGGPYFNVDTSGLQDEGWGNPVPHEFGHVIDGQQPGNLAGGLWESHANYHRESWVNWFSPYFATGQQSTMGLGPLQWSNYRQDTFRLWYADHRISTALNNYDPTLESKVWYTGNSGMTEYDKLATLLPAGTSVQDVVASALSRWPMLDFQGFGGNGGTVSTGSLMRARLWDNATNTADYFYLTSSMLTPTLAADQTTWYRVPEERAPEKYAYMWHWLTPTSTTVTVNLQGINTIDPTQDWRWRLEEVDANNNVIQYSSLWGPGTHSITLTNVNNRLILFVAATPGNTWADLGSMYNTKLNGSHVDRLNYPYEVQITGATPTTGAARQIGYAKSASGHAHSNGGGWVDNTATVASTAYVGPNARVLGTAQVLETARIEDYAVVSGGTVRGSAKVSGYAVVAAGTVQGYALIRDHAYIDGGTVQGNAQIEDHAYTVDNSTYTDSVIVRGNSFPFGTNTYSGTAILDYDYSSGWNRSDGIHMGHFPWGMGDFEHYFDITQSKPRGLVASYRVNQTSGDLLWDEFGAEQAYLKGSPSLVQDAGFNSAVLGLNGSSQYVDLERNLADFTAATYGMWVKPTSVDADETLLYFGGSTGDYLKLVARDAGGFAHLTIKVGATTQNFASTAAVPLNQWTHVAITFGSGTVTFYINGVAAGTLATAFRPTDVLGANTNDLKNAEACYIGRDATGNYFTGQLEDMRFYNVTLTQAEVTNEMSRGGAIIGLFYAAAPMTFDGSTTKVESGVHNGLVRTLKASIRPHTSKDVGTYYEPVFDSNYEYGSQQGSGFGVNNGYFVVRLDGYGMWNTGVAVSLNAWQDVALTFDGTVARFYLNGAKVGTLYYTANPNNLAGKNYRIGYGLANGTGGNPPTYGTQTFFDGDIQNAQIYDRVVIHDPDTYQWDTSASGGYQGGNGTWNTSTTNWSNGDGTTLAAWPSVGTNKTAAFDTDTAASNWAVTVSGTPTPYAIDFGDPYGSATDKYTLSGGTLSVGAGGIAAYVPATVNSAVTMTAAQTWDTLSGQTLTVGGNVNNGGYELTLSANGPTNLGGNILGGGKLTKNGSGTLTLSGANNTYGGGTAINSGTVIAANSSGSALGTAAATIAAGATLHFGNGDATGSAGSVAITNNGAVEFNRSDAFPHGGTISGSGTVTQFGPGALTLTAANSFSGDTRIISGGLVAGNVAGSNSLALQQSTLNYTSSDAGTLSFASTVTSAMFGGLKGDKDLDLRNTNGTPAGVALSVGNNNQSTSYSGKLTGTGSLVKLGTGTLTVSAASTYGGGTNVSNGTLLVNNTTGSGLGSGTVAVNNSGTLGGSGTISGPVNVNSGGTLGPGAGGVGALTTGALQLASGSILNLELNGMTNDTVVVSNFAGLTINGGNVYLYQPGTTTAFAAVGTYTLITHTGAIGGSGVGSLTVANLVPGFRYSFSDTGTAVTVTISQGPLWSGASGAVWSATANWSGNAPTSSDPLVYAAPGNLGGTSVNDLTGASFPGAAFSSGAAAFTLTGNGVTFTGDSNGNVVLNQSSSTQTINLPVTLGASGSLNAAAGPIVLGSSGSITNAASRDLTIKGAGDVTLNGTISGPGGVIKSADAGSLNLGNANALGSGTLTINGGKIDNTTGAALTLATNNPQTWGGDFTFAGTADGTHNLNLGTGTVNFGAASSVRATINNGVLTVGGPISGSGKTLSKDGGGTMVLSGNGSTVQTLTVNAGVLKLDKSGAANPSLTSAAVITVNGIPALLDINNATLTTPGIGIVNGRVVVEGASVVNTTGTIRGYGDNNAKSYYFQGSAIINGAGQNLQTSDTQAQSSYYILLQNGAQATFANVGLIYAGEYNDGHGHSAVMEVKDTAQLTTSGTLWVMRQARDQNRSGTLYMFAQVYQHGGTVTVGGNLSLTENDTAIGSGGSPHETSGTYNLGSGSILKVAGRVLGGAVNTGYGQSFFNFHGGTLVYNGSGAQTDWINLTATAGTAGTTSASNLRNWEGATIDPGSQSVTINQAILAPTGQGVSAISTAGLTGVQYANGCPPWVYISGGGGSGASAVATLDANGYVNGIVITNPGNNYTSTPTVLLTRGGSGNQTVAAGNITLSANSTYGGGLTKINTGTLTLNGANTYAGATTVSGGTLKLGAAGSIASTMITVGSSSIFDVSAVTGGYAVSSGKTLQGVGNVTGNVTTAVGGIIAPGSGTGSIGTLIFNNALSLGGTTAIEINKTAGTSDKVQAVSTLTYGGALTVTNLGGTLAAGDTFTLFSAGSYAGSFATINLPWLPSSLKWDTSALATNGTITVIPAFTSIVVTPSPVNLSAGGTQTFTATAMYLGSPATPQPGFTWTTTVGTVDTTGLFMAPNVSATGTVTATSGSISGSASVVVTNHAPTVATPAAANLITVMGTTTSLSVLGADDAGESNLSYTWSAVGPGSVSYDLNGSNAAKNSTATFSKAGDYVFTATITDAGGLTATSSVGVTVVSTRTVTVTPGSLTTDPGAVRQCTAAVTDQFGMAMTGDVAWSTAGGSITSTGLFTAPATGTATVTASSGTANGTATVTVLAPYGWWKFNENTGTTAADSSGNNRSGTISPTPGTPWPGGWSGAPADYALVFNGTSSKVTVSNTLSGTGDFTLSAWVKTTATAAGVIIQQRSSGTNNSGQFQLSMQANGTVRFFVNRYTTSTYQFNLTSTQTINDGNWHYIVGTRQGSTSGYLYIDGVQRASATGTTNRSLSANNSLLIGGDISGAYFNGTLDDVRVYNSALSASLVAGMANRFPIVSTAAAASPATVAGTTTNLSVRGADSDGGEANLRYVWSATGPAGVAFSANGTNAAQNTTATFTKAGTYNLTATIADAGGLAATSSVSVTVDQTLTSMTLSPPSANLTAGSSQQFTATALDQFGNVLTNQPAWTWSVVSGGGSVTGSGLYTPPYRPGSASVRAVSGLFQATASIVYSGQAQWNSSVNGPWNAGGNWKGSVSGATPIAPPGVRGIAGDTVLLASATGGTVSLNGVSPNVAGITFDNSGTSYTIAQGTGGTLTLDDGGNSANLLVSSGSHTITAPVVLASNTTATVSGSQEVLMISGQISGSGKSLTKQGDGTLVLSNSNNTYSGGTIISGGVLRLDNAGALPAGGNLTIGPDGTLVLSSDLGVAVSAGTATVAGSLAAAAEPLVSASAVPTASSEPVSVPGRAPDGETPPGRQPICAKTLDAILPTIGPARPAVEWNWLWAAGPSGAGKHKTAVAVDEALLKYWV